MIIIRGNKKGGLLENAGSQEFPPSFTVDYWGVKVTYKAEKRPNGEIFYSAGQEADKAAKILSQQALAMFAKAKASAKVPGFVQADQFTSSSFLPKNAF